MIPEEVLKAAGFHAVEKCLLPDLWGAVLPGFPENTNNGSLSGGEGVRRSSPDYIGEVWAVPAGIQLDEDLRHEE